MQNDSHPPFAADQPECLTLLMNAGADINAANDAGMTPVHTASHNGESIIWQAYSMTSRCVIVPGFVGFFVVDRCHSCATPHGLTLHDASGNHECLQLLLEAGADVTARDKKGRLPANIRRVKGAYPSRPRHASCHLSQEGQSV